MINAFRRALRRMTPAEVAGVAGVVGVAGVGVVVAVAGVGVVGGVGGVVVVGGVGRVGRILICRYQHGWPEDRQRLGDIKNP